MEGPSGSALQQDASTNDGLCSKCSRPLALGASAHIQCTTQGPVTCKACNTPITRGGVYAMEGSIYHAFHARCFKCDKCGNPIEDRVEWVDGKKLHPRCVKKTCEHCGLEIADSVVVNGKTYHPEHFLCKTCKMPIFGRYYTHQNNYYCGKACAKGVIRAQQQLRPPPFASLYVMAHTLKPGTVPWPAEGVSLLVDVANSISEADGYQTDPWAALSVVWSMAQRLGEPQGPVFSPDWPALSAVMGALQLLE